MRVLYFSTAILPSQYANSVHVMKMCNGLVENKNELMLIGIKGDSKRDLYKFYNIKNKFKIILLKGGRTGVIFRFLALLKYPREFECIYTRYTLAAYICGSMKKKNVVYEYHAPSVGFFNKIMEKKLSKLNNIRHIFITESLRQKYYCINPELKNADCIVLPDSADVPNIKFQDIPVEKVLSCGFIGSFQKGKGVEIVGKLAGLMPNITFHIVGGKKQEINGMKKRFPYDNIIWHGFLNQKEAMQVLEEKIDIALLPNQKNVMVGRNENVNIGEYTSPMKLFEYMSYGKGIISSNLPVLKEVVSDDNNAILVDSSDVNEWKNAIDRLNEDRNLLNKIRRQAFEEFNINYTWESRAYKSVKEIKKLRY